ILPARRAPPSTTILSIGHSACSTQKERATTFPYAENANGAFSCDPERAATYRLFVDDVELDAPILRAALRRVVVLDRILVTMSDRLQALGRDALFHEVRNDARRTVLRQLQVLRTVANVIRVPLDLHLPDLEVGEQHAGNVVEQLVRRRRQLRAA